jgi:hypothetical protein
MINKKRKQGFDISRSGLLTVAFCSGVSAFENRSTAKAFQIIHIITKVRKKKSLPINAIASISTFPSLGRAAT